MAKMSREEIAERLRGEDLDEWLRLWREEQGPAKPAALALMAAAVPPPGARGEAEAELRVLDLGCGPGDAGRAVAARFPRAWVDFLDRDLFFISLCAAVNERDGIRGRTLARDLLNRDWRRDLADGYDVVVAANSLHWMSEERVGELFAEIFGLLRGGGCFLFMEPVGVEASFAVGFDLGRRAQPSQHREEDWMKFWSRVNALVGFDYVKEMGERDPKRIDDKLPVMGWVKMLKDAGFGSIDVLLRDAEKVLVGAVKR
jgi:SAM-dependent methyltransferase